MRTLARHLNRTAQPSKPDDQDPISKEALRRLGDGGLSLPDRPDGEMPRLPADVTELSDEDLMSLYGRMVAWSKYAAGRFAVAEVVEKATEDALAKAHAAAIVGGKERTATAAKARAADDPAVTAARSRQTDAYALRKLTGVVAEASERDARFLSRELTRRTGIGDINRRNDRWNA